MISVERNAYAKINIGLDIKKRREDGYHEVYMVMQSIDLYDTITITRRNSNGIIFTCDDKNLSTGEDNLILKAARLFYETQGITQGVHIHLVKRIPVAAGMAGGSTDAAATLMLLNELFEKHLSKEALMRLGVKLGADVPYCILGGTALAEGIGEKLSVLTPLPDCQILIIKPPIAVSTKYVYETLNVATILHHPNMEAVLQGIERSDISVICENCENILENVTCKAFPIVQKIKDFMKKNKALLSLMSGSGPTVFGIYSSLQDSKDAFDLAKKVYPDYEIFLTKPKKDCCK